MDTRCLPLLALASGHWNRICCLWIRKVFLRLKYKRRIRDQLLQDKQNFCFWKRNNHSHAATLVILPPQATHAKLQIWTFTPRSGYSHPSEMVNYWQYFFPVSDDYSIRQTNAQEKGGKLIAAWQNGSKDIGSNTITGPTLSTSR